MRDSWNLLQGKFLYRTEHFVVHLPLGICGKAGQKRQRADSRSFYSCEAGRIVGAIPRHTRENPQICEMKVPSATLGERCVGSVIARGRQIQSSLIGLRRKGAA